MSKGMSLGGRAVCCLLTAFCLLSQPWPGVSTWRGCDVKDGCCRIIRSLTLDMPTTSADNDGTPLVWSLVRTPKSPTTYRTGTASGTTISRALSPLALRALLVRIDWLSAPQPAARPQS